VYVHRRDRPEVFVGQQLFALEIHGGMRRIMGGRRMTCGGGGVSQLCLGKGVAEVGVLRYHGIRREGVYERGYLAQPSTKPRRVRCAQT